MQELLFCVCCFFLDFQAIVSLTGMLPSPNPQGADEVGYILFKNTKTI